MINNWPKKSVDKSREKTQINKIREEKGDVTTDSNETKNIMRSYCEQLYANKLEKKSIDFWKHLTYQN